jgi:peptide chain release factor 1
MDAIQAMDKLEAELGEVERALSQPNATADNERFKALSRRHAELQPIIALYHEYQQALRDREEAEAMLADAEDSDMYEFLSQEVESGATRAHDLEERMLRALVPRDPMADKPAIIEIRAGTGGDEAGLFAHDLFTMYTRMAERRHWKSEILELSEADKGGIKEIVFKVDGPGVYGILELESGVHRVQRVPETEAQGRIHTSAATVAVLPEVEDVEIHIEPSELSLEVFRAGGPGGQHMQKNDTAVRITHLPTGITVAASSERSQLQNRERAMGVLRARLYELRRREQEEALAATRRTQIGSGDRSEKIRTYNFPQDRLTDHRIGLTLHNLPALLGGELDELVEALQEFREKERLVALVKESG